MCIVPSGHMLSLTAWLDLGLEPWQSCPCHTARFTLLPCKSHIWNKAGRETAVTVENSQVLSTVRWVKECFPTEEPACQLAPSN